MSSDTNIPDRVYVVRDTTSPAAITSSLQTLLPTRCHPIARHRYTVLDTFDGRIARANATLTATESHGSIRCSWRPHGGRLRLEVTAKGPVEFASDFPDGSFQRQLASVVGIRRLLTRAEAEGVGSQLDVLDQRTKTVARVRIESARARLPTSDDGWHDVPTIITVSGLRGFDDEYERLLPIIESRPGVEPCAVGVDVLLRAIGAPEPCDTSSLRMEVPATTSASAGVRRVHLALLDLILANEPGLRDDLDPEFLHDFRVAVRRTRSLLGQVRRVLPASAVERFATEFSWLGQITGPPRDMDVLLLELRAGQDDIPAEPLAALAGALAGSRQQDHRRLVDALESDRYRRLVTDWRAFLTDEQPADPALTNAARPLGEVAARRAWRLSRNIRQIARTTDGQTDATRLHELRIVAKKLRYLVELTPCCDSGDRELIVGGLKRLQRSLGDCHDADVQERRLLECGRELTAGDGQGQALLVAGRLAEQRRQYRIRMGDEAIMELERFCSKDMRAVIRRAFKPSRESQS
jgi:CHAD domain-containing protein